MFLVETGEGRITPATQKASYLHLRSVLQFHRAGGPRTIRIPRTQFAHKTLTSANVELTLQTPVRSTLFGLSGKGFVMSEQSGKQKNSGVSGVAIPAGLFIGIGVGYPG